MQPPASKLGHQMSWIWIVTGRILMFNKNDLLSPSLKPRTSHHIMLEAEEEKVGTEESGSLPVEDGGQNRVFVDEVLQLRAMLNKTVAEKDTMAHEYKVERNGFIRELFTLHQKLEVITSHHSPVETGEGQAENHQHEEKLEG
ncbi:uncharacterized protein LOC113272786 [Papaver somniferum]|uniref:uncharacterized protein LOC113272786 n=1 Tax=Papaver somniferum TaxID=3469 RepID=UPI000E6FD640|nr:uncharacterized protein LOC113272786 [Papaver somniferum]